MVEEIEMLETREAQERLVLCSAVRYPQLDWTFPSLSKDWRLER